MDFSTVLLLTSCCKAFSEYDWKLVAGSLESPNSSILAARWLFKEVVRKKSGFYYCPQM